MVLEVQIDERVFEVLLHLTEARKYLFIYFNYFIFLDCFLS